MVGKFTADVEAIVLASEKRMLALIRQSVQDVVEDAQTPVAKGGRMRVDTGFLRASGRMSLTGLPQGPVRGDNTDPGSYTYDENNVIATLGQTQIGSTIYFGWTANYAKYREAYDGFLDAALQNWQKIVDRNTEEIRKRITK